MKRGALVAVTLAIFGSELEAGPWNRPRGSVYVNVSYEILSTTSLATPDGVEQQIPRYELHQVGVYAAYGLSDRLTAILDRFGFRDSSIEAFESASGVEDVRAGLQWQLPRTGPWLMAARGILQLPTGDETKGLGLLPTGSGAWEGDLLFSMGRSSRSGRVYGYWEAGHRVRGKDLRDSFLYEGQIGVRAFGRTLLVFNLRGVKPYRSEPGEGALASPAGLGDGTTYTVIGPAVIIELGRGFGIQAEAEDAFNATNVATGLKGRIKLFYVR